MSAKKHASFRLKTQVSLYIIHQHLRNMKDSEYYTNYTNLNQNDNNREHSVYNETVLEFMRTQQINWRQITRVETCINNTFIGSIKDSPS